MESKNFTLLVGDQVVDMFDDIADACHSYDSFDQTCDPSFFGRVKSLIRFDGTILLQTTVQSRTPKTYPLNFDDIGYQMCAESDSYILSMIDEGFFRDIEKEIRELCRRCVEHGIHLATERLDRDYNL